MINQQITTQFSEQITDQLNKQAGKKITHIQFTGINKRYVKKNLGLDRLFSRANNSTKHILNHTDLELIGGECVLLTGKNGSGKSTLLRILSGLLKPDSATVNTELGSLSWKQARKNIRQQVMYLYQEPYMFDGSVTRNLEYALHKPISQSNSINLDKRIKEALKWANLEHRADTSAKCLSGGERQRVALAQAWLKQPSVLLLDEPTANMDTESRYATEELLFKFKSSGTALLIASHDINHFKQAMDRHLLLEDGIICDITLSSMAERNKNSASINDDKSSNIVDNNVINKSRNITSNSTSNVSLFPKKRINS